MSNTVILDVNVKSKDVLSETILKNVAKVISVVCGGDYYCNDYEGYKDKSGKYHYQFNSDTIESSYRFLTEIGPGCVKSSIAASEKIDVAIGFTVTWLEQAPTDEYYTDDYGDDDDCEFNFSDSADSNDSDNDSE